MNSKVFPYYTQLGFRFNNFKFKVFPAIYLSKYRIDKIVQIIGNLIMQETDPNFKRIDSKLQQGKYIHKTVSMQQSTTLEIVLSCFCHHLASDSVVDVTWKHDTQYISYVCTCWINLSYNMI